MHGYIDNNVLSWHHRNTYHLCSRCVLVEENIQIVTSPGSLVTVLSVKGKKNNISLGLCTEVGLMILPTRFFFLFSFPCVVYKLISAITMGAWSLPGSRLAVRAFLFPRIDGLSRKRGSDRAEEERNLLWGLTLLLFYFYLWSCSLSSRAVLTVCMCAGSRDIRRCCSVLQIPLNLPPSAFKMFISNRSCCFLFSCLPHLLLFPCRFQSPLLSLLVSSPLHPFHSLCDFQVKSLHFTPSTHFSCKTVRVLF